MSIMNLCPGYVRGEVTLRRIGSKLTDDVGAGLSLLCRRFHRPLRARLPRKHEVWYNGVMVGYRYYGDDIVPWRTHPTPTDEDFTYKEPNTRALRELTRTGDTVIVIGGGWGVTSVAAATQAGRHGTVIAYDGSLERVRYCRRTARFNGVADRVNVRHEIVAHSNRLNGVKIGSAERLPPSELPSCDILELDCEGAETDILREMESNPRVVIVETHGFHGAPTADTTAILRNRGYDIVSRNPVGGSEYARDNDAYVLVATRT